MSAELPKDSERVLHHSILEIASPHPEHEARNDRRVFVRQSFRKILEECSTDRLTEDPSLCSG
jgi:hypothetical protein